MKHSNVIEMLAGSLWMATDQHVQTIRAIGNSILDGSNPHLREAFDRQAEDEPETDSLPGVAVKNGVAVMKIAGTIMPRATMFSAWSGGTSAEAIRRNALALADRADVHTVLLDIDSNGGSVHGVDAAANAIRELRTKKRVWAVANYNMNSAAYWIGSAAERIFVTPTSNIGSIGVISVMQFLPEEDQKRFEIVRSVPGKADVTPYEPLSESARKKLQSDVDKIHATFVNAISLNRNISMDKAEKLADGHVDLGADAVETGMADQIVESSDDILAMIDAEQNLTVQRDMLRTSFLALQQENVELQAEMAEIDTELAAALARISELEAVAETIETSAVQARAEAVVSAAVRDGKLATGSAAGIVADLVEGQMSFEAFERLAGNIPAGALVPTDSMTPIASETSGDESSLNDEERRVLAQFPSLKGKF